MSSIRAVRWILLVLSLAASSLVCSSPVDDLNKRPPSRHASPPVQTHGAGRWRSGRVDVLFEAGFTTMTSGRDTQAQYLLVLVDSNGEHPFQIDRFSLGPEAFGQLSTAEFTTMVDASFTLQFALDDHAIALSSDGGVHWRYVGLDAGDEPLHCPHRTYVVQSTSAGLWSVLPTTRELVLDILATRPPAKGSAPGGPVPHLTKSLNQDERFHRELLGARRFLCLHPEDAQVQESFTRAIVASDGIPNLLNLVDVTWMPLLACLQDAARSNGAMRKMALDALATVAPELTERRARASEILARTEEVDVQEGLAAALRKSAEAASADFEACWLQGKLAWSLASVTTLRHAASEVVRDTLIQLTTRPTSCLQAQNLAGLAARVYAVRGLAALTDPVARQALEQLGRGACTGAPPAWPASFNYWNEVMQDGGTYSDISCWAQVSLAIGH